LQFDVTFGDVALSLDSALSAEDNQGTQSWADSLYDTALLPIAGGGEYYIPPHKDLFSKVVQ
jgi:hypothetical protein